MNGDWPTGVNEEDVFDLIDGVTASLTRRYRQFTQPDDIRQELRLYAWKKRNKFAEYLVRESEGSKRAGEAAFMKSIMRWGEKYCRREKAKIIGYQPSDEFFYNPGLVETLIAAGVQGMSVLANQTTTRANTDPAEGGNAVVMIIDVATALDRLEPEQKHLLLELHGAGVDPKVIAVRDGVSRQAIGQRNDRALRRLIMLLGGEQ